MIVKAFCVLKPGLSATMPWSRPCRSMSKATIAPFKYPRQIEFRDTLPRTETGKLQRFKLRTP
jgi:2-aminobenzoate-CoA ligase